MIYKTRTPKPPLAAPALLEFALRSLSSKMKSIRDLKRKLTDRAEPGEAGEAAVEAVILKLKDFGYLSYERFAADYTRLRSVVSTRLPTQAEADALARPTTQPVLVVQYVNVDRDGVPVEAATTLFAADAVQLVVEPDAA